MGKDVSIITGMAHPRVAILSMSRHEKKNALSVGMISQLLNALAELKGDPSIGAVVLYGGAFFSAGGDLSTVKGLETATHDLSHMARLGETLCDSIASMPIPVIAAVEGGAIGGGISLAAACDLRVMAQDTWIWAPEVSMGLYFGWGTLCRLEAIIGPSKTKLIGMLGRRHSSEECLRWGFADALSPPDRSLEQALGIAVEFSSKPRRSLTTIKQVIDDLSRGQLPSSASEVQSTLDCFFDDEGVRARAISSARKS